MKKLSQYEHWVLVLAAVFAAASLAVFVTGRSQERMWQVTTQRSDSPSVSAGGDGDGWPDSLLEGEVIDLNTADVDELARLPGIGARRAQAIVDDRRENGPFDSVDQLERVNGIGKVTIDGLRGFVTVGEGKIGAIS